MANVDKPKQDNRAGGQPLQKTEPKAEVVASERAPVALRDPFDLIREFFGFEPFRSETFLREPLFRDLRDMVRSFWESQPARRGERGWRPAFEVRETDDDYRVIGDVPGLADDDLDVTVSGDRLVISGKREHEVKREDREFRTCERAYGSFTRTFDIPADVDADHIQCRLESGVLEVVLPKKPDAKPAKRKIAIKSGQGERH
jgi:HSP20 family protein